MAEELVIAADRGTITAPIQAGGNALCDSTKQWRDNFFRNYLIRVTGPTGQRELAVVDGNSRDALVIQGSWLSSFPTGSSYEILALGDLRQALRDVFGGGTDIIVATEATLNKVVPIAKADIFNAALPAANTDILAASISPTNSPSWLRIYVTIAVAGRLYLRRTVDGVTVSEDLNSGANLTANAAHCFGPIEWRTGDSLNLRYSATGGNILVLRIDEIGAAE